MEKLNLNLDDLSVDSFAPESDAPAGTGTVHGQDVPIQDPTDPSPLTEECGGGGETDGFRTACYDTVCYASCGGTCIENTCGLETIYACFEI
jgi:hypothetical protein